MGVLVWLLVLAAVAWRGSSSIREAAAAAMQSREGAPCLDVNSRRRLRLGGLPPPGTIGSPIPVSYAVDRVGWWVESGGRRGKKELVKGVDSTSLGPKCAC